MKNHTIPLFRRIFTGISALVLGTQIASSAPAGNLGNFGPTGIELAVQKDHSLLVTGVQTGSPADGIIKKGQVIEHIDGNTLPEDSWQQRMMLGDAITRAEAGDGSIKLTVRGEGGAPSEITVKIPAIGAYADTWPLDCPKTDKIVRAHADWLARHVADSRDGMAGHNMNNALGILALLSTGEDKDLDVVRGIYQRRMAEFKPDSIGSHSWHNGYQGIAVCEYYLRSGDKSVMPLIDAICEAARKWQVQGGWTHWATGVNPQYVGGGLLNAAGTNLLTTLLLAKHCGAKVDDKALLDSLTFFYRFAGHGANPYGDHRPEGGYGSNNGKTEQVAAAMHIASKAKNGDVYAMARDKCALSSLYSYRSMLGGHTGPIGLIWYAPVAHYLAAEKPDLYRNRLDQTRWFYELSRRHDGSLGMSGGARYDTTEYGRSTVLGLTAPRRTLQITGAPGSPHSVPFTLPERPWGRPADLAFFTLDGGPNYQPLDPVPHRELEKISTATQQELARVASHPEYVYREETAAALRAGAHYDLIEKLLGSPDPLARHTGCLTLNDFQPWSVSRSRGWISSRTIGPENFTPRMFQALIAIVRNPDEALWLVDQAMIALALATPEQTKGELATLLPWLEHDEWWLRESASIALSPALTDSEAARKILPGMAAMLAATDHLKGRGYVEWMLARNIKQIPEDVRHLVPQALMKAYVETPSQVSIEGEMDRTGISSVILSGTMNWILTADPSVAPEMAKLSAARMDDMRPRELAIQLDSLISAARKLDPAKQREVGEVLSKHYRPHLVSENPEALSPAFNGRPQEQADLVNKVLQIDQLAGRAEGWQLLDNTPAGNQQWFHHSFQPAEKLPEGEMNRYRQVALPANLENWFMPDYDPAAHGWTKITATLGNQAPDSHRNAPAWKTAGPDKAGEVLFLRKTFELDDTDHAMLRLVAYTRQGYRIYLNGQLVVENKGRSKNWLPKYHYLDPKARQHLKQGTNVLAATSFMQYFRGKEGDIEVYLEGLDKLPPPER